MLKSLLLIMVALLITSGISAQEIFEWEFRYGHTGDGYDGLYGLTTDSDGNIIATGRGLAGASQYSYDIITVKLDQNGDTVWLRIYDSDSLDQASAVVTDTYNNIYVVGLTDIEYYRRPLIIKYNPDGDTVWTRTVPVDGGYLSTNAYAAAIDEFNGIYITGSGWDPDGGGYHMRTAKYDTYGNQLWEDYYDYPGDGTDDSDRGWHIEVHPSGYVYVSGYGKASSTTNSYDMILVKYDLYGSLIWDAYHSGYGEQKDYVHAMALDAVGNVYLAGYLTMEVGWQDFALVKFNADGSFGWEKTKGIDGIYEEANDVVVDGNGDIIVGGWIQSGWADFYIAKYDIDGNLLWDRRDFTNPSSHDMIHGLAVDEFNNIYAVGESDHLNVSASVNMATVKYSASGDTIIWDHYHDGPAHHTDGADEVLITDDGNVVVGGRLGAGSDPDIHMDFALIMYSQPYGCCTIRGDIDHNTTGPDIADLVYMVNYMFNGGPAPLCDEDGYYVEADIDGNLVGPDIADLVYLVNYMFNGGLAPAPCP